MKKIILIIICFMVGLFILGCGNNENNDNNESKAWFELDANYTYNTYISDTKSMNWNPLNYQVDDEEHFLDYLTIGFYEYQLDDNLSNLKIVPEMATDFPVDVTSNYVGKYGITEGDKGKAWSISLNETAKWENGVKITAEDYVYSMKQLLDPTQHYSGSDLYCGGNFSIYNASNYLNSLQDGSYETPAALGYEGVQIAIDEGMIVYLDIEKLMGLNAKDAETKIPNATLNGTLVPITSTTKIRNFNVKEGSDGDWISAFDLWKKYQNELDAGGIYHSYVKMYVPNKYKGLEFEDVGIFAEDDYTLVLVLEHELLNPDFYLPYYLSKNWLINEELYESCWSKNNGGTKINTYMTSKATSISYGPYMLSSFENDKQIIFTRNKEWYGYYDGKHNNQYQTDTLNYQVIDNHEDAILAFEKGEIDSVILDYSEIKNYSDSENLVYVPKSQTTSLKINTRLDSLMANESIGINKRILTVKQFREALSLCINRTVVSNKYALASRPSYSLLSQMHYIIDETGYEDSYRNYEAAKESIVKLYGIEYGTGTRYRDLNSAYRAITGYDIKKARKLLQEAYDFATQNNLYNDKEIIKLSFVVPSTDAIYNKLCEYLNSQINKAAAGTPLEGKIELELCIESNYQNLVDTNKADIILSTTVYSSYDVFSIMSQVCINDSVNSVNQLEIGIDSSNIPVTVQLGDNEYTYSLKEWADWLNGIQMLKKLGHNSNWTIKERVKVFAACESAYLSEYSTIPLYYGQAVNVSSKKINYGVKDYFKLIKFGTIRYINYNYSDEEWEIKKLEGIND